MTAMPFVVITWRPHVGDPDALGWITTLAYFVAAFLCWRAARREQAAMRDQRRAPGEALPAFWGWLAVALVPLGINKQLDLQVLARQTAIDLVTAAGYGPRQQWVGRGLVAVLALGACVLLPLGARSSRGVRRDPSYRVAFAGVAALACFIVLRAGTYLPGLRQLNNHFKGAIQLVLELGGLVLIALAALRPQPRNGGRW